MTKERRNQLIAIGFLVAGIAFLYIGGISQLPVIITQNAVLLKGIALVLLSIAAILGGTAFENKQRIALISGVGLVIGLGFLYWFPMPSVLRGSAFHILFACAIAFGMTTHAKRIATIGAALLTCIGFFFLYQPFFPSLGGTALHLLLPSIIVFSIVFSQKTLCERFSIGLIALGLIALCQPFFILFYQTGFQLLLTGLTGFIVVAHR